MKSRQACIEDHIRDSIQKMIRSFEYDVRKMDNLKLDSNWLARLAKRDMLYGHASSFISGLMQPAYAAINRERGLLNNPNKIAFVPHYINHII